MTIVAGVDGGGTHTRVALWCSERGLLGVGEAGSGNLHDVGPERLRVHLAAAFDKARHAAGDSKLEPEAAFCGMASVVVEADREIVRALCRQVGLATGADGGGRARIEVDHDLRIALAGGLSGRPGVVLIAGTGSSAWGRTQDGREWQASGWGSFLDDRGSAFDLGRGALVACVRSADGRGPATALSRRVRDELRLTEWRDLLRVVDAQRLPRARVAALAVLVTEEAARGDAVARALIEEGVAELALAVATVARRIDLPAAEVAPTGGLARSGPVYRAPLDRALRAHLPRCRIVEPELPPVAGACLLALEGRGLRVDADGLGRLRSAFETVP